MNNAPNERGAGNSTSTYAAAAAAINRPPGLNTNPNYHHSHNNMGAPGRDINATPNVPEGNNNSKKDKQAKTVKQNNFAIDKDGNVQITHAYKTVPSRWEKQTTKENNRHLRDQERALSVML